MWVNAVHDESSFKENTLLHGSDSSNANWRGLSPQKQQRCQYTHCRRYKRRFDCATRGRKAGQKVSAPCRRHCLDNFSPHSSRSSTYLVIINHFKVWVLSSLTKMFVQLDIYSTNWIECWEMILLQKTTHDNKEEKTRLQRFHNTKRRPQSLSLCDFVVREVGKMSKMTEGNNQKSEALIKKVIFDSTKFGQTCRREIWANKNSQSGWE